MGLYNGITGNWIQQNETEGVETEPGTERVEFEEILINPMGVTELMVGQRLI